MKKLINDPNNVVREMLEGFATAHHGHVRLLEDLNVVVRKDSPVKGKVALVSGGGSGHEPAHAGYVGAGMLDAACAGDVFTSPNVEQILGAIRHVDGGSGVLLIIKNYTGDVLNFEMAMELAANEGISIDKITVNDDVSVEETGRTAGRRGIAGTIFIHKIAGARAEAGGTLHDVKASAETALKNLRSMGMALSPCTVPATGKPSFTLADDEMEIGMGIHGEPGVRRTKIMSADKLAETLLEGIMEDLPLDEGDEVALMTNGLGSTPVMELYIVHRAAAAILKAKGFRLSASYVGEFMTSLEMSGCSLTLLRLNSELKPLLFAPARTPAFIQI
ncbi:MAG: dihydroxyacetone kinase subunit DhaK [Candidatus Brocadiales bacterium]|nr:dihydroxyacetone kinase subunit DhaK [Candidatus Bathyanammoxibius amoris]